MGLAASYVAAMADRRELEWAALRDFGSGFGEMTNAPLTLPHFGVLNFFDVPDLWKTARGKVHFIRSPEKFIRKAW